MVQMHEKLSMALNCIEHLLILSYAVVTGCV